jgi:hypothetical protein
MRKMPTGGRATQPGRRAVIGALFPFRAGFATRLSLKKMFLQVAFYPN